MGFEGGVQRTPKKSTSSCLLAHVAQTRGLNALGCMQRACFQGKFMRPDSTVRAKQSFSLNGVKGAIWNLFDHALLHMH